VSLSFERYDSADLLKMITEDLGKEAGDEVVAGLGERAVWKDKAEQLKVVVDHDLLTLTLVPAKDVKPRKEQSIDLMKKILARR
jgi:hypothetical protein